jgi:hypothetical protein
MKEKSVWKKQESKEWICINKKRMKRNYNNPNNFYIPKTIEEYENCLENFNWNNFFSEDYYPFLETMNRHYMNVAEKNGEKWKEKYTKIQEKYIKLYKKV